jgi:preprotein translocase subunit SecF
MLQIFTNSRYDFMGLRRWAYLLSTAAVLVSLAHVAWQGGLRYGIDFAGGTLLQVRFQGPVTVDAVRRALSGVGLGDSVIQEFGDDREHLIRVPAGSGSLEQVTPRAESGLRQAGLPGFEVRRVEYVGPQVGQDLQWNAIYAVLWGMVGILVYTAVRFDFRGGVVAITALLHDVVVSLGALSLTGREMSLPVLAALLTIVGYSINDTIVTYDRIRENRARGLRKGETLADAVNLAINQTLSRTVLTALTTFMAVAVLYAFGGEVLRDFAFALLVGVVIGTYSTIFVAAPLVVDSVRWSAAPRGGAAARAAHPRAPAVKTGPGRAR